MDPSPLERAVDPPAPPAEDVDTEGTCAEGVETDGVETDGTVTDGVDPAGVETDGTVTDGVVTEGVVTDGTVTDGVDTEGVETDGSVTAWPASGTTAKLASNPSASIEPATSTRSATFANLRRRPGPWLRSM